MLNLRPPWWVSLFIGKDTLYFTKSLEWAISYCVMEHMFNDQFNISTVFMKDVEGLRWRFIIVGVAHFLLLPFMLVFMVLQFFLQNAQQFRTSGSYLGPRQWSPLAVWTFREFNELPHMFETRLNKSIPAADEFLGLFRSPYTPIVARSLGYMCGAVVGVLVIISVFNEAVLLHVQIADHNLLWFFGVFAALYAASRALITEDTKLHMDRAIPLLETISACTHYFPKEWEAIAADDPLSVQIAYDQIAELYPYKLHIFAIELLSVIFTPILLCFSLPESVPDILNFIR